LRARCSSLTRDRQVLDLDPVWHYNKDLRIFHPEHMVVIGDDGIKALCRSNVAPCAPLFPAALRSSRSASRVCRSVSSADAARSYRAGTFQ
jgi:hypothetical protein